MNSREKGKVGERAWRDWLREQVIAEVMFLPPLAFALLVYQRGGSLPVSKGRSPDPILARFTAHGAV
jgi:hypothetical protein